MRNFLRASIISIVWLAFLTGLFVAEEYFGRPTVERGDVKSLERYLDTKLKNAAEDGRLGSGALILLHEGKVALIRTYGASDNSAHPPRVCKTLYLVSSVSKAVTAWGMMKLVVDGKIGLDEPIYPRLKRWRFPGSDARARNVTIRHLLTHTSGLVDGFGYSGFPLDEPGQTPIESLNFPTDSNHGEPHPAIISSEPGTVFSYSSAGYTVLQILVEDITGEKFSDYMTKEVLLPLGMTSSGYDIEEIIAQGRKDDLAPNYDTDLRIHPFRKYAMMAGGSLRVTATDMAAFLQSYSKETLLTRDVIQEMATPQAIADSAWAIGHEVYVTTSEFCIIGHGGGAFPRTGAAFRLNTSTGNAIAVMMTGGTEMIDPYLDAWQYFETGLKTFDFRNVIHKRKWHIVSGFIIGLMIIIFTRRAR